MELWQILVLTFAIVVAGIPALLVLIIDNAPRPLRKKMLSNKKIRILYYKSFIYCYYYNNRELKNVEQSPYVYEWEYNVTEKSPNNEPIDINTARPVVHEIYKKHTPHFPPPTIVQTNGRHSSGTSKKICLTKKALLEDLLHEASHSLVDGFGEIYETHGSKFVSIFIKLLAEHGFGKIDALVKSARRYGVKTLPANTIKKRSIKRIAQERESNV